MIFIGNAELWLRQPVQPSGCGLYHHNIAKPHINAPTGEGVPYLVTQLSAMNEEQNTISLCSGLLCNIGNYDRFSAAAGEDYAGCFAALPISLPHIVFKINLILPQRHLHSPPASAVSQAWKHSLCTAFFRSISVSPLRSERHSSCQWV